MSSSDIPPPATPSRPRRLGGTLSIDWKLPLLITAVLAAGLAAFLVVTYVTFARRSEEVTRDRFRHASLIVAGSIEGAIQQRVAMLGVAARQPAVRRVLRSFNGGAPLAA